MQYKLFAGFLFHLFPGYIFLGSGAINQSEIVCVIHRCLRCVFAHAAGFQMQDLKKGEGVGIWTSWKATIISQK